MVTWDTMIVKNIFLEGLKILQNRVQDSAGISMIKDKHFETKKFASNNVNDALHILEKEMSSFDNIFVMESDIPDGQRMEVKLITMHILIKIIYPEFPSFIMVLLRTIIT